ncbi:MAG: DUF2807 domain-containing protein [Bacteroidales bacterium]|nr:DUF2807 domain-containing protein [Bacteroidales bacterium]
MKRAKPIISLTFIVLGFIIYGCSKDDDRIKGQGPVVSQSFDLLPIEGIALSIDADIVLTQGDSQQVRIEAQQNIINNIEKYVLCGIWEIGYYNPVTNHVGVKIYITSPVINNILISGSGNVESTDIYSDSTNVFLTISGSGNIYFHTIAYLLESEISGSGQIYLTGSAFEHHIHISGSGNVKSFNLETYNTCITISGSGNSEVQVENLLNVIISGSGNVYYIGNPQINATISGSGGIYNSN